VSKYLSAAAGSALGEVHAPLIVRHSGTHPLKRRKRSRPKTPPTKALGWREWAQLPDLNVRAIKAKLDTGARTSALHAFSIKPFMRDGVEMVRFDIHPVQRSSASAVHAEAEVLDHRVVKNSGGHQELRPVIQTTLRIGDGEWPIELTLTRRDEMGFRMLLGREALRGRAVVDPGSSFREGRQKDLPAWSPDRAKGDEEE